MGIVVSIPSSVDDTFASVSEAAGANVILKTYNGNGSLNIVNKGDGHMKISLQYIVDGGAPVTIGGGNVKSITCVGFTTSLVVQVFNTDNVSAHPQPTVSVTGTLGT